MKRTDQQNRAFWKYCQLLAEAMNDAGFDQKAILDKKTIPCPNNKDSVMDHIWRPIMKAICYNEDGTPKESTKSLNRMEVSQIYEVANRFTAEKFGISIPFPSEEDQCND